MDFVGPVFNNSVGKELASHFQSGCTGHGRFNGSAVLLVFLPTLFTERNHVSLFTLFHRILYTLADSLKTHSFFLLYLFLSVHFISFFSISELVGDDPLVKPAPGELLLLY
jgi:hypothetical protein